LNAKTATVFSPRAGHCGVQSRSQCIGNHVQVHQIVPTFGLVGHHEQ